MENKDCQVIAFTKDGLTLDARVDTEKGTVWLTRAEIAELFGVDRRRIVRHLNNIYRDDERAVAALLIRNRKLKGEDAKA